MAIPCFYGNLYYWGVVMNTIGVSIMVTVITITIFLSVFLISYRSKDEMRERECDVYYDGRRELE